tara:strand:- start:312 stop:641 length:330 start_codon:yes stop_codon:yes gene_type:complete
MARPKKKIEESKVEQLASFGCTNTEIASFFNVNESTIRRGFAEYLTKGRDKGKIRLRQMQWKAAEGGNVSMLIWLGKQVLGQTEQPTLTEDEIVEGFDIEVISSIPTSE